MPKFICIETHDPENVEKGDIIVGELTKVDDVDFVETTEDCIKDRWGHYIFPKGTLVPLVGNLYVWQLLRE